MNQFMYPNAMNNYFQSLMPQQQYSNFAPQNFPPQQNPIPQINSRFVTNVEEAKAAMIDPLSYNLFLDTNSGKIYLKKLSNNGQSEFLCYTVENTVEQDPFREINTRLSKIEGYLGGLKNDKSISGNSGFKQSAANAQSAVTKPHEPDDETKPSGFSENARNDKWEKRR